MKFKVLAMACAFGAAGVSQASAPCALSGVCVDPDSVMGHLKELQKVANTYKDNRSAGSLGHELSGNYIAQKLLKAGYDVKLEPFDFTLYTKIASSLSMSAPVQREFKEDEEFKALSYSGSGSSTSGIQAVDLDLGEGNQSTSGCEGEDFAAFTAGKIALVQRGACAFADKAINAQKAGATGVIIFNQGNDEGRMDVFNGTLSEDADLSIPVVAISYALGKELIESSPVLSLEVESTIEDKVSFNVIAESKTGDPNNVVMVGAHLDSVAEGPGINDNGSGSAAILSIALAMAKEEYKNKMRFAWFSAEELGLVGSTRYVEGLSESEKNKLALYINVDMVGSPNYKLSVFDGDGSKFGQAGPKGSESIESAFHKAFSDLGVGSVETELNGRSDYAAFSAAGIAVGGIFTGAEGVKTKEEAELFGGVEGAPYDECYHKACDSIENINKNAIESSVNALASVLSGYGMSVADIRSSNKSLASVRADKVVFPEHLHCHEDVFQK